jgi:replicative DNA helicase
MTIYQNQEAEQVILGTAIMNNSLLLNVADILESKHFSYIEHQEIWKEFIRIGREGGTADPVTLKNFMQNNSIFKDLGGSKYLMTLMQLANGIADLRSYAKTLIELWQKREFYELIENCKNELQEKSFNYLSSDFQNKIAGLEFQEPKKQTQCTSDILDDLDKEDAENLSDKFVETGFYKLDNLINGGLYAKQLYIIGARPSVGKTTIGQNIILNASRSGKRCLFISLEVDKRNVMYKFLSNMKSIDSWKIQKKCLNQSEVADLQEAKEELRNMKIYVNDSSGLNITQIKQIIKNQIDKQPVDLVVVDYIQIMKGEDTRNKNESLIIKENTTALKSIAKQFDIPILALAQINRKAVEGSNQEPTINDFKSSGGIEEDADVAMILHRDRREDKEDGYFSDSGKIIIAKNRHGRTGVSNVMIQGNFGRFLEIN